MAIGLLGRRDPVLVDLRRTRRAHRVEEVDWVDALYKAYLTAIFLSVAVVAVTGWIGDHQVTASAARRVASDGPAVVGAVAALAVAIALRSAGKGGPLAVEAPDVRFVLLSPVPRALALRGPALKLVRFVAFAGAVVGAVVGQATARRLPGNIVGWTASGAAVGVLSGLAAVGAGLLASGRRVPRAVTTLLALGVLGWSAADIAAGTTTSPFTWLGALAVAPLTWHPYAIAGVAVPLVLAVAGLATVGGLSLEAAERRAALVAQLRFAATLNDVRTVLLLRRQLAQERPRDRGWFRVRPGRLAIWRRDWRGAARWPAVRLARLAILGAVAGVSLRAAWGGTTLLVVVAGLAMYVVGLEAVEGLAQDVDHPDLVSSLPHDDGVVHVRHLPAAVLMAIGVGLVGVVAAVAVGPDRTLTAEVAFAALPFAAAAGVAGAALSTMIGGGGTSSQSILPPEAMGMVTTFRTFGPPMIAVLGALPVLAGRYAWRDGQSASGGVFAAGILTLFPCLLVAAWVRFGPAAKQWWTEALENSPFASGKAKR